MKGYLKTVAVVVLLFVCAVAVFVLIAWNGKGAGQVDGSKIVMLNDIAKEANDRDGLDARIASKGYNAEFVILDVNNAVIYDSRTGSSKEDVTIESAIKNRYPYVYILDGNRIEGCVILIDDSMAAYRSLRGTLLIGLAAVTVIVIVAMLVYGIFVHRNIIRPFRKMEQFAGKVAEGKLDEPLLIERNNMFGTFSESFDIMREELSAAREREIALQKKEKELVASLSHDLKTPITGIKLTTELLKAKLEMRGGAEDGDIAVKLDNIYSKADQIDALVTDLFASTLDDLGEFKVNLTDESSAVIGEIITRYDDRNLVRTAPIPEVIINTDPKRLSQVIGNIINNSYKYAGTAIDVEYRLIDGLLEMKISDHGPGVPSDELDLITNKFYRGKAQAASGSEGSGLGLYIARMLMEKMNGALEVSSDGDGFAVVLLVPLS